MVMMRNLFFYDTHPPQDACHPFLDQATDEEKAAAKKALEIYSALADTERGSFLKEFDAQGGKYGKVSNLKWVGRFEKSIIGERETEISVNENFLTRTVVILKMRRIIF